MKKLLAVGLLSVAGTAAAQPVRTLSTPQFEYSEPFSGITGLRELRDGRVVVADTRDKTLQAIDLKTGRATAIGREGSGPNEWGMPMRLMPYLGDSLLVVDPMNSRFLLVSPEGRAVRTIQPALGEGPTIMGGPGAAAGAGGRGGTQMMMSGGLGVVSARSVDRQGRVYSEGSPFVMTEQGPASADSVPLLRAPFGSSRADTVAWIQLPKNAASVQASGGGNQQTMSVRIGGNTPFVNGDQWSVAPDGRVVIARVKDYRVDVVMPDKRVLRGAPVAYTPVRVTEADKEQWREARRNTQAVSITNNNGAVSRAVAPPAMLAQEPDSWPATKSPFGSNAVWITPNGQAWVQRQLPAAERAPTFDVFDATGKLTGQVKLPPKTRLLGFGAKGVYLARNDDDDLQYIQHHALTW